MPKFVNIDEAKTQLSRLVEEIDAGVEVTLIRTGNPIARLTRIASDPKKKRLGLLRGKIRVSDDFNAPSREIITAYEGHLT